MTSFPTRLMRYACSSLCSLLILSLPLIGQTTSTEIQPDPAYTANMPISMPTSTLSNGKLVPGDILRLTFVESADEEKLTLLPGDDIRISMVEDPRVAYSGIIPLSGLIPIPFLGEVPTANKTTKEFTDNLKKILEEKLYRTATVSTQVMSRALLRPRQTEFTVPDSYMISLPVIGDTSVGYSTPSELSAKIKAELEKSNYVEANVSLSVIQKATGSVVIYGAVTEPGLVPLPPFGNLSILELIAQVDGLTSWAKPEMTYLQRRIEGSEEVERIPIDLAKALQQPRGENDVILQAGDMIFVPSGNSKSTDILGNEPTEVIVVGQVSSPGMILFAPGESRTLLRALLKAGGFGKFAKKDKVRLIRLDENNNRTVKLIDAETILEEGFINKDVDLLPGDMIIVGEKVFSW